jgi:N-ethylmaleimide reductase
VGFINVPGIYSEAQTEGWKLVTKACTKGRNDFAQLWHTGRLSHPDLMVNASHASALNPFCKRIYNDL